MIERRLLRDINPAIGDIPLDDLTPRLILEKVLRPMEIRGANDLAHRVGSIISQIMRFGVSCGLLERDPTTDLRGALKPVSRGHHAALDGSGTPDPVKVGALLRALDGYDGTSIVTCALRLHPLVATRPGELRHAEWDEIDFDQKLWEIPAGKMKMKQPHVVPLSTQAIAVLRELQPVTGMGQYLFHSVRTVDKPISNNSLNAALRRLGYMHDEFVPHGWRAVFSAK